MATLTTHPCKRAVGDTDAARDHSTENHIAEVLPDFVRDLGSQPGPPVVHGQQDRRDPEFGVEVPLDQVDRAQ